MESNEYECQRCSLIGRLDDHPLMAQVKLLREALCKMIGLPDGDVSDARILESVHELLARVRELEAERGGLREVLTWYAEQARLCRLIHSEGDAGRNALSNDGGNRARAALGPLPTPGETK